MKKLLGFLLLLIVTTILLSPHVHAIGYANTAADLVIGQQGFNCQVGERQGDYLRGLYSPFNSVLVVGTKLIIPAGNGGRLIIHNTIPTTNYPTPDLILGQNDPCILAYYSSDLPNDYNGPTNVAFDGTRFYVADNTGNRVLIYNHGIPTSQSQGPDVVVGQPDFSTKTANTGGISASTLSAPYDVWSNGTKLIVSDQANNRILIWNTIPTTNGQSADIVIGQTDMITGTSGTSSIKLSAPRGLDVYDGKLYVADQTNHRVLVYNSIPTANSAAADLVFGQSDMNSKVVNSGGLGASSLNTPTDVNLRNGKMFIGDKANSRVLIFNSIPTTNKPSADVVVGQPDMTTNSTGLSSSKFGLTYSGYSDGTRLYVMDYGNNRILIYNTIPTANGAAADVVIGQQNMTSNVRWGQKLPAADNFFWVSGVWTDGTGVYVGDSLGNRALKFNSLPTTNGAAADVVLGQPDMTTVSAATSATKYPAAPPDVVFGESKMFVVTSRRVLIYNSIPTTNGAAANVVIGQPDMTSNTANNGGLSAKSIDVADGVLVTGGKLIIGDPYNNRVLIFNSIPTSNFASADVVIGQPDMVSNTANNGGLSAASLSGPRGLGFYNGKLFVTDYGNNRVLIYNSIPTTNGASADVVIGQPDFTSSTMNNGGLSSRSLKSPRSVTVANGVVYISDSGNSRVLVFDSIPTANYAAADAVLGQADMTHAERGSTASSLDNPVRVAVMPSKVLVADAFNSRVVGYSVGPHGVSVTGGGLFTPTTASITLAADDAKEVMVSEDPSFTGASWSSFATTKSVIVSAGSGIKTLYVKMRDYANFESSVYTTTITIDDQKPSAVKITDIGKITNVPNKSPLYYYFTSQTAKIRGTAEAGSTVHFKYGNADKMTVVGTDEKFTIEISGLPRELTEFSYYAVDTAGNKSDSRILKLMIGEENFPVYLVSSTTTPTETPTPTAIPTAVPTLTVTPTVTSSTQSVQVKDEHGNVLANTTVLINGKKYTTDSQGRIPIDPSSVKSSVVEVEINGKKYSANILGQTVVAQTTSNSSARANNSILLWLALGASVIAILVWVVTRKR